MDDYEDSQAFDELNGYDKDYLLSWFGRRGIDTARTGINKLGVTQMRVLAGAITRLIADQLNRRSGAL